MTQANFSEKIGNGVDKNTHADLLKRISTKCPTGISRIDGKWVMDSDVQSSTRGAIAASYKDIDFEHVDMHEFGVNWTATDYILEAIRCHEERQREAAAEAAEIKADKEHRAAEEAEK